MRKAVVVFYVRDIEELQPTQSVIEDTKKFALSLWRQRNKTQTLTIRQRML
jgi:hypothetical protein